MSVAAIENEYLHSRHIELNKWDSASFIDRLAFVQDLKVAVHQTPIYRSPRRSRLRLTGGVAS